MNASVRPAERPLVAVLDSILGNLQDIVRSEIRLVKSEARDELSRRTSGAAWMGFGVISAFFALSCFLGAAFLGLMRVLPDWAAALTLAAALTAVSAVAVAVYRAKAKQALQPAGR